MFVVTESLSNLIKKVVVRKPNHIISIKLKMKYKESKISNMYSIIGMEKYRYTVVVCVQSSAVCREKIQKASCSRPN